MRINLWSCPRNVSTALMYAFAQRSDTRVYDEPLYAHYLRVSGVQHPGQEEILNSQEQNGEKVVGNLLLGPKEKSVLFFKQMTHHLVDLKLGFLNEMTNVLFIRKPEEIIVSYSKVRPIIRIEDIGVKMQFELFKRLEEKGSKPLVLDSHYLLESPKEILQKLCEQIGIPFDENMLHWEAGARPEDGVWAKYWYANVHQSKGLKKREKKEINLNAAHRKLAEECQGYYHFLVQHSLK